ncbi:DUF3857 domain-containing protein [bacterium]|nr:DUF3857 domain-containing protein [bacterium]
MIFNYIRRSAAVAVAILCLALPVTANTPSAPKNYANAPGLKEYPNALALILEDDLTYTLNADMSAVSTEHNVVKILNKEGAEFFHVLPRICNTDEEKMELEYARVITPDGKVINVNQDSVKSVPVMDTDAHDSQRYFIVEFPPLEPDSIIEFSVKNTVFSRSDKRWCGATYLQNDVPILHSTYKATVPVGQEVYTYTNANSDELGEPKITERNGKRTYYWNTKKPYDVLPSGTNRPVSENYYKYIAITNFSGWEDFGNWAGEIWRLNIADDGSLNMLSSRLTSFSQPTEEKINNVLNHMNNYIVLNKKTPFYTRPNLAKLSKSSQLTVSESAYLLGALLTKSGLKVEPYLLTLAEATTIDKLPPIPSYVSGYLLKITDVTGKNFWIDPSVPGKYLPYPSPSQQKAIALKLPVKDGETAKIEVTPQNLSIDNICSYRMEGIIDKNGSQELSTDISFTGMRTSPLLSVSKQLDKMTFSQRKELVDWLINQFNGSFTFHAVPYASYFPEIKDTDKTVTINSTVRFANCVRNNRESKYYETPIYIIRNKTLQSVLEKDREYPVCFDAPFVDEINYHLILPKEAKINSYPESINVSNDVGSFVSKVICRGNEVWFYNRVEIKEARVYPEKFAQLQELAQAQVKIAKEFLIFKLD